MEESVKQRILAFIKEKSIGQKKFEETVGLSNGYVNNLKASPSSNVLQKIFNAYPDLNKSWLLTGEGSMLSASESDYVSASSSTDLSSVLNKAMDEIAAQRRITEKSQQQIDRLLSLLEADRRTSTASSNDASPEEDTEAPRKRA